MKTVKKKVRTVKKKEKTVKKRFDPYEFINELLEKRRIKLQKEKKLKLFIE